MHHDWRDGGPEARRGTSEAARHVVMNRLDGFVRCRSEVIPKPLQNSGNLADKPVPVQVGVQVISPFGGRARPFWAGADAPRVRATPAIHAELATRDALNCPGLRRVAVLCSYDNT